MDYRKERQAVIEQEARLQKRLMEIADQQVKLFSEYSKIATELAGVRKAIHGLEIASGEPSKRVPGLREHIRSLLAESRTPLTPVEIRDSCRAAGVSSSSERNLMISIHTALNRMGSELRKVNYFGKIAYEPKVRSRRVAGP